MANEGSTKPTYSELERLAKAATPGPWGWYRSDPNWLGAWCLETQSFSPTLNVEAVEASDEDRAFIAAANPQTILDLLAELARVRGLLQRQWISVEERLPEQCGNYLTAGTMFTDETIGKHVAELSWDGSEWRELRDLLPMSTFGSIVTHWRELPEPPSGAESADIGKLDRVDKEGAE